MAVLTARLSQLFQSDTVTIFPHSYTVRIAPQWHCYDCSTVRLLWLLHSEAVATVSQWHGYDFFKIGLL